MTESPSEPQTYGTAASIWAQEPTTATSVKLIDTSREDDQIVIDATVWDLAEFGGKGLTLTYTSDFQLEWMDGELPGHDLSRGPKGTTEDGQYILEDFLDVDEAKAVGPSGHQPVWNKDTDVRTFKADGIDDLLFVNNASEFEQAFKPREMTLAFADVGQSERAEEAWTGIKDISLYIRGIRISEMLQAEAEIDPSWDPDVDILLPDTSLKGVKAQYVFKELSHRDAQPGGGAKGYDESLIFYPVGFDGELGQPTE